MYKIDLTNIYLYIALNQNIKIGNNTFMSRMFITGGYMMDNHFITIFKTTIGKNCIFESYIGVMGVTIGNNSIFQHITGVMKGQICRSNAIYEGVPCKKVGDNDLSQEEIEELKQNIREYDKIKWGVYLDVYKIYLYHNIYEDVF